MATASIRCWFGLRHRWRKMIAGMREHPTNPTPGPSREGGGRNPQNFKYTLYLYRCAKKQNYVVKNPWLAVYAFLISFNESSDRKQKRELASLKQYWTKIGFARANRSAPTDAEKFLWLRIRKRQLNGHRFRRQHIISRYIVDFVCLERQVIIEVNGGYHYAGEQPALDNERTMHLNALGFRILAFDNETVTNDFETVRTMVLRVLDNNSE
jgi:very-short-patch-repair endonuclease